MALRQIIRRFSKRGACVMFGAGIFARCEGNTDNGLKEEQRIKFNHEDYMKFSYDYMIKQSTIDAVNSASQALTVTYSAIESTSREYRELLGKLINLLEETTVFEVSEEHRDLIVAVRAEMQNKKLILNQLLGYMDYVQTMAEAVTNVSFLAGMENLSISLSERMGDARKQKEREIQDNQRLEGEYVKIQEQCVRQYEDKQNAKLKCANNPEELKLD